MAQDNIAPKQRNGITIGELVASCLVVLGAVLSFWISTERRLTAIEIEQKTYKEDRKNVTEKLDQMQRDLNQIMIILQNKEDRK